MTSAIAMCNSALGMLGDNPITSFNAGTKAATLCNTLYPQTRDRILRMHPWLCARKRVLLAATSVEAAFDWSATFQLPGDCLRLLQVGIRGQRLCYEREGNTILASQTTLPIVYTARVDESLFDAQLADLLTVAMAKALAYPITKSPPMQQAMNTEFETQRKRAGAVNGQENPPEDLPESTIESVRF